MKQPRPILNYTHPAPGPRQEAIVDPARCFYASVRDRNDNGGHNDRHGYLAGPFLLHQTALDWVDRAEAKAKEVNAHAIWYSFGTLSLPLSLAKLPFGVLNDLLGVTPDIPDWENKCVRPAESVPSKTLPYPVKSALRHSPKRTTDENRITLPALRPAQGAGLCEIRVGHQAL
jgi:hypothetical protein